MEKSKVYFTRNITSENVLKMYKVLNIELQGRVCVKVHSGEAGNQNYLKPLFFKDVIDYLKPGDCLVRNNTKVIPAR